MIPVLLIVGFLADAVVLSLAVEALRPRPEAPQRLYWDPAITIQYAVHRRSPNPAHQDRLTPGFLAQIVVSGARDTTVRFSISFDTPTAGRTPAKSTGRSAIQCSSFMGSRLVGR